MRVGRIRRLRAPWCVALLMAGVILNAGIAAAQTRITTEARTEAESIFGERCAVCHGENGDGKGPVAASLNPKPIDFQSRKWQRSVTNEKIAKVIVYGGPAAGLSASMSANPDLETRPEIVAALVERIRSLAPKRH